MPQPPHQIESFESRLHFSATPVAGLVQTTHLLSEPRIVIGATSVGGKAFFSGGVVSENTLSRAIDIFDSATGQWSVHRVDASHDVRNAVSAGTQAIFTGLAGPSDIVDIYDTATGQWKEARLSQARSEMAIVSAGNKVFFAGGYTSRTENSRIVDLYDTVRGSWSVHKLSQARGSIQGAVVGNKVLFVGGFLSGVQQRTRAVDVYDLTTEHWSKTRLSEPRSGMAVAVVGDLAIFAGGTSIGGVTRSVEFFNAATGRWSTGFLPHDIEVGPTEHKSLAVGTKAFFAGRILNTDVLDQYDAVTNTWSTLNFNRPDNRVSGVVGIGKKAVFAIFGDPAITLDVYDASTDQLIPDVFVPGSRTLELSSTTLGNTAFLAGSPAIDIFTDTTPASVLSGGLTGAPGHRDQVTVINTGDANLRAGYTIQLYATLDRTLGGAILVGSRTVTSSLPAGASSPFNIRTVIPKDMPAGSYHLLAAVRDTNGNITPIAAEDATFRVSGTKTSA